MKRVSSYPILTCVEAKRWEARALPNEAREWGAMFEAGSQCAFSIMADFNEIGGIKPEARILVLCGKGHNGGDALLAAKVILMQNPQAKAFVVFCFGMTVLRPLTLRAVAQLQEAAPGRVEILTAKHALKADQSYALCLDGIFGFQFRPPMNRSIAALSAKVNNHPAIQLRAAIDLPSGINKANEGPAFRADFTYATGIVKSPVIDPANAIAVGRLRFVDLGLLGDNSKADVKERILTGSILVPLAQLRSSESDKRTYGHLCVIGGSRNYPGAVMLAVRAAMRSGAGLVTAFVPEMLVPHYAAQHPEVMWVGCPLNRAGGLAASCLSLVRERSKKATAFLIGPGLGDDPETLELVRLIAVETKIPLAFDADALRPEIIKEVLQKRFVCTPHAGEFKRIQTTLYARGKFVASRGVVVVKGPLTRVADRNGAYYSPFGGPVLARGGSGDMLAGLIGGLLAQTPENPVLAACRGVVWHGIAADLLARTHGQVAVENSQLLEQLGPALISTHDRFIDGAAGVHGIERSA